VVNELRGEKVDIIPWAEDASRFVSNALSPAKVKEVRIDPDTQTAEVIVPDFQLSLAIGKEGQNARLAARLTGWRIDIKSETQIKEIEAKKLFVDLPEEEPAVLAGSPAVEGQAGAEASGEATSVPEEPAATEAPNAAPAQALDVPTSSGAEGAAADGEAGEPVAASEAPADPDHATKKTAEADA